jgi:hypothetical protein
MEQVIQIALEGELHADAVQLAKLAIGAAELPPAS